MAGLNAAFRPSGSSSSSAQGFASKLLLLLAALPLTLAALAFVLQWRGGLDDPTSRWPSENEPFPGMGVPLGSSFSSVSASSSPHSSSSDCADILGQSSSPSLSYYNGWKFDANLDLRPKICITTSTSAGLEQILPWIFYHKVIGVTTFLLFVEGKAAKPNISAVLESIPDAGVDWIIHLDTDELLYPSGAREYSLRQLLQEVPGNVDMVIFPNYESSIEHDDIKDPFSEVSMFKRNYDHLPKEAYFGLYKEATRGNPNYFLTYGNGKSAARIQDHLRPNGAHRWHNYMKTPNEIKLEEAAVLHYTYAKFSDLTSRRDRCGCKPTKEDVKRCFMLDFDRSLKFEAQPCQHLIATHIVLHHLAFIIASTATEEEMLHWFREHVVWTDKQLNLKLLRKGILTRIYAPMSIIQDLRESGVFRSVIASARKNSKEKLSTSIENPINSSSSEVLSLATRNSNILGRAGLRESEAVARKILEVLDTFAAAIPPLSPPALEDFHRVT